LFFSGHVVKLDVPSFEDLQESSRQQRCRLSSSKGKRASESLINSAYSVFITLFTIYFMHEIMNYRMFNFPYHCPRCWIAYGWNSFA
jgi:hypothetical protein